jgi:DNA-binding NtrC family response regulator
MINAENLLIIEDDAALARGLGRMLTKRGYEVRIANGLTAARDALAQRAPDVVLADISLPDGSGVEIGVELERIAPGVPLILMTGMPSVDSAVAALRSRAFDYLTKPFTEEELSLCLSRALEVSRLRRELTAIKSTMAREDCGIVGHSPAIVFTRERLLAVAPTTATVLVTGESGVGKERVARAVHELSGRTGPFVPLNCSSIPETLFEAELFGAKKGAYTGSVGDRPGLVAEAARGTLFLDEIGDMPPMIQPKLLRLLQERTYRSLGSDREARADVRVVAATNRPLRVLVDERRFREDLYWRLAVVEIGMPPLRDRREDIVTLTAHILSRLSTRLERKAVPAVSQAAIRALEGHSWPGNVRELENVLERAVLFSRGPAIEEDDLCLSMTESGGGLPPLDEVIQRTEKAAEREYIVKVMRQAGGSVTEAARLAGRNRTSFYRLLEKHAIRAEAREDG